MLFSAAIALSACSNAAATNPTIPDSASPAVTQQTSEPAITVPGPKTDTAQRSGPPATESTAQPALDTVYNHTAPTDMSPAVANARPLVYVPSNDDGSVTVIDQATLQVVAHYHVGKLVQHVVADWDMKTLYATVSDSNALVRIDPTTGQRTTSIKVAAPYNLYFTPDGTTALVVAERLDRIDYYDRTTWKKVRSTPTKPCRGVNHVDWSADGSFFLAACEFSGDLLKIETATGAILSSIHLAEGAMPQDVRLAPDGTKFYTADMEHGCVWIVDGAATQVIGSIETGVGPHGIYPSRDGRLMYVTNRGRLMHDVRRRSHDGDGSISVIDPTTDTVTATWQIPGGGSPDMGGVSADGTKLWVSGRYDAEVYVFDTTTGDLAARIPVPAGPHGLNVFPQPGRYSLGHTDSYR